MQAKHTKELKQRFTKNNDAVSSVISVLMVMMIFLSSTAAIMMVGPQMIAGLEIKTQTEAIDSYFKVTDNVLNDLTAKGENSIGKGEISIDKGQLQINEHSDKIIATYSYDPDFDFDVDQITDENKQFILNSNIDVSKVSIYHLQDTCFLAGTQVAMADGSYKNIEDVVVGDLVLSFDEETKELTKSVVKEVFVHTPDEMPGHYLIINDELKVTPNHLFYSDGEWVFAGDLSVGDMLFDSDLKEFEIKSLARVYEKVESFDLDVEEIDNFFVNVDDVDVLVHNWPWPVEIEEVYLSTSNPSYNNGYERSEVHCAVIPSIPGPWDITSELDSQFTSGEYDNLQVIDGIWTGTSVNGNSCDDHAPECGVQQNYHFQIAPETFDIYGDELVSMSFVWSGYTRALASIMHFAPHVRWIKVATDSGNELVGTPAYLGSGAEIIGDETIFLNITSDFLDYLDDENQLIASGYVGHNFNTIGIGQLSINTDKVAVQFVNALPECSLSADPTSGTTPFDVTFTMSASDPTGQIAQWILDFDDGSTPASGTGEPPATLVHTYSDGFGSVTAELTVWDTLAAETTDSVNINRGMEPVGPPPTCTLTPDVISGNVPLTINFGIFAADIEDNAGLSFWSLDADGDKTPETSGTAPIDNPLSTSYSHTYNLEGTYTATLTVRDLDFLTRTDTVTITVVDGNQPPYAPNKFSWDSSDPFYDGIEYNFTVKTTDPNGDPLVYRFDWGDETFSPYQNAPSNGFVTETHSYDYAGVYEIRVKAKDPSGQESEWSDPVAVNVDYKFIAPHDADVTKTEHISRSEMDDSVPGRYIVDTAYKLTGSVIIYLYSDDYPSPSDPAAGEVSFGTILLCNLGAIEYSTKTSNGEYKTILESGGIISKSPTGSIMHSCSNIYEEEGNDANTLGLTVKKIRGIDSTAGSGSGIYELKFKTINTIMREEQVHMLYNIKLEFSGDYAEAWKEYLVDNYKFLAQGNMLVYNYGKGTHMIFSTSVIQASLENII